MRERVSLKQLLRNFQQQVEQVPHLSQMARDTLERLSQPHAHNAPPPEWKGSRHDWLGRLVRGAAGRRRRGRPGSAVGSLAGVGDAGRRVFLILRR